MAAEVIKPDFSYVWASGGAIVAPSDVKKQTGWTAEVPPFQWENWSQNRQDNAILHLFQKGISEWDAVSNYYFTASGVRSYVQGSDGVIYVAVADSVGQNPTTDATDTYWKVAFIDQTALNTAFGNGRSLKSTSSSSLVVPTGVTSILVSGCAPGGGGGGGGGSTAGTNVGSGGGGGGAGQSIIDVVYTVVPGTTISWTIGSTGVKGIGVSGAAGTNGTSGGNTVITGIPSGTVTLTGGGGGIGGSSAVTPAGNLGGTGFPRGGSGQDATANNASGSGAFGGTSPFGGGGSNGRGGISGAPSAVNNGSDADGYGSGGGSGGGVYTGSSTAKGGDGGNGAPGFLIFKW